MEPWAWLVFGVLVVVLLITLWTRGRPQNERPASEARGAAPETAKAKAPAAPNVEAKSAPTVARPVQAPAARTSSSTGAKPAPAQSSKSDELPAMQYEEDEEVDPTRVGAAVAAGPRRLQPPAKKIVYDEDAATDEPTRSAALILVTAQAQTDKGLRRKRNEDSILALAEEGVFVVADGMGGYQGGEIASALAVKTIEHAFRSNSFDADPHTNIPSRASELARAIQMANEAILEKAQSDKALAGMGTTICAVRFAPSKQRLYVGHVGDSRLYRVRAGQLRRMTSDHTMADMGVSGPQAAHLSRAVGVWPTVAIDVILGTPAPGDVYILCSDGLTKMVKDEEIARIATATPQPSVLVEELVNAANANGGKDNISVIVIGVASATGDAKKSGTPA